MILPAIKDLILDIPMRYQYKAENKIPVSQTHQHILIRVGFMFRPLYGRHQAFNLKQVFKMLHTLMYATF